MSNEVIFISGFVISVLVFIFNRLDDEPAGMLCLLALYLQVVAIFSSGGNLFTIQTSTGQIVAWSISSIMFLVPNILGFLTGWAFDSELAYISSMLIFSIAQTAVLNERNSAGNILLIAAKYGAPIVTALFTILRAIQT